LLIEENKAGELQQKLIKYRQDMLAVDTVLSQAFEKTIIDASDSINTKTFSKDNFRNTTAIEVIAVLRRFENVLRITENNFLRFCLSKASPVIIIDDYPTPLVSQNASVVSPGENIEVTAGIGIFASLPNEIITINGKRIKNNENGFVVYKMKASEKTGKNKLPVKIEFSKADGTKILFAKDIEYTVIKQQ
ncbi:MAG: hypothetical protein ABUT20_45995, partial [Bacteroidota bacterium]